MNLQFQLAERSDVRAIAEMNARLILDEGHRNTMTPDELHSRMAKWLDEEYTAAVFKLDGETVGYALYKYEREYVYLRQFFVAAPFRRRGVGRSAIEWLMAHAWREAPRIRLDVLVGNGDGIAFWRSVGFRDYCLTMETP